MHLRKWQAQCVETAIQKFSEEKQHFLCLATPGAGKTIMAAEVARRLLKPAKIDFVICFTPSITTTKNLRHTIERKIGVSLTGRIGSKGVCMTYQSLTHQDARFWDIFVTYRTLVIFDEIHHCGGNNSTNSNAWGQHIIVNIQNKATYTLALSGTPWRSDNKPVTLSNYCNETGHIVCDFEYGLNTAIKENVCRRPCITVIDNTCIVVENDKTSSTTYKNIEQALKNSDIPYQSIVDSSAVIEYCLMEANKQLLKVKRLNPSAAGLVVTSSIEHAEKVARILKTQINELVQVVNYKDSESSAIIENFQNTNAEWLVSVGMVSEGTNIPRLQVCCHLTRIKTELHFRQILGRIMRLTERDKIKEAHLFAPAQPNLVEYAKRLSEDIPDAKLATIVNKRHGIIFEKDLFSTTEKSSESEGINLEVISTDFVDDEIMMQKNTPKISNARNELADTFFNGLLFKGRFKKTLINF